MLKLILTLCMLCACARAQDPRTIFQYLQDEDYDKLVELIVGAGIADEFQNTDSIPVTLFAPTNAAFNALPDEVLIAIQTNTTLLKEILNGHVVDETILGLFVRNGLRKTSKSGTTLNFNTYPNKVKTVNGASLGTDVILANGVVHQISKVLMPLDSSISAIVAESDPEFRDLFGFIVLAKLFGTLSTSGPFTVFAPTDSAFENVDVTSLIANRTALGELLKHHVVSGAYWSAGLTDGMKLDTLYGSQITITTGSGVNVDSARVTTADVGASNGVIHIIDSVLTP